MIITLFLQIRIFPTLNKIENTEIIRLIHGTNLEFGINISYMRLSNDFWEVIDKNN